MPDRLLSLLLALLGLAAVACLILAGTDVRLAASRGYRWKRRLLGAGLAVIGWFAPFSFPSSFGEEPRAEAEAGRPEASLRDDRLAASGKWNRR